MKLKITPFLKIWTLVAISLFALGLVAPAFATEQLYLVNSEVNYYTYATISTETIARGRYFMGNDEYLSRVAFYLRNSSATSGTVTAKLYNTTAAHLPSVLQETSTTAYDLTGLTLSTFQLIEFDFSSNTLLNSTLEYCVTLEVTTFGTEFALGLSNNGAGGIYRVVVNWATTSNQPIFYIYTDDTLGGGTPYTPPGTADLTSWDVTIQSFVSFMVPLIVMLLPALLLMFLTRRTDKWLLIIGLAIGAGLGYYFGLVPLWLVFLIVIGLIGMAYQSVRGGNS